jgi:hypothetical protein
MLIQSVCLSKPIVLHTYTLCLSVQAYSTSHLYNLSVCPSLQYFTLIQSVCLSKPIVLHTYSICLSVQAYSTSHLFNLLSIQAIIFTVIQSVCLSKFLLYLLGLLVTAWERALRPSLSTKFGFALSLRRQFATLRSRVGLVEEVFFSDCTNQ